MIRDKKIIIFFNGNINENINIMNYFINFIYLILFMIVLLDNFVRRFL